LKKGGWNPPFFEKRCGKSLFEKKEKDQKRIAQNSIGGISGERGDVPATAWFCKKGEPKNARMASSTPEKEKFVLNGPGVGKGRRKKKGGTEDLK